MTINLIRDEWLPVVTRRGQRRRIAPWQLTEDHDGNDPIVALSTDRPDFRSSLQQFLIGLLQTAIPPSRADAQTWTGPLLRAPEPAALRKSLEPLSPVFDLHSDGPMFMQDLDLLSDGTEVDAAALLIDSPGKQSVRNNADFFVKRGRVKGLCPPCAAIALFTLQTNAPAGGSGIRTSVRGGGPLTTLITIDPSSMEKLEPTLWRESWLNVIDREELADAAPVQAKAQDPRVFPWLAATRTSEHPGGVETTPNDAHPLQAYWGMPRRMRIDWTGDQAGVCDLCGDHAESLVTRYRTRPRGVNYTGPWRHPLSPYYSSDPAKPALPLHPQPGGIGYRHWLMLAGEATSTSQPAAVVRAFRTRMQLAGRHIPPRLHVSGYDMENMKPRCWYESTMPIFTVESTVRDDFSDTMQRLIDGAQQTARKLRLCIRDAWIDNAPNGDLTHLDKAFYGATEAEFFRLAHAIAASLGSGGDAEAATLTWRGVLRREATSLFTRQAAPAGFEYGDPRRVASAHQSLRRFLYNTLPRLLGITDATEVNET